MSEAAVVSITSFGLLDHWIVKDGVLFSVTLVIPFRQDAPRNRKSTSSDWLLAIMHVVTYYLLCWGLDDDPQVLCHHTVYFKRFIASSRVEVESSGGIPKLMTVAILTGHHVCNNKQWDAGVILTFLFLSILVTSKYYFDRFRRFHFRHYESMFRLTKMLFFLHPSFTYK